MAGPIMMPMAELRYRAAIVCTGLALAAGVPVHAARAATPIGEFLLADASGAIVPAPHEGEVDTIITGGTQPAGARATWEEARKRFLECGACGDEQPFPDKIPEAWVK